MKKMEVHVTFCARILEDGEPKGVFRGNYVVPLGPDGEVTLFSLAEPGSVRPGDADLFPSEQPKKAVN